MTQSDNIKILVKADAKQAEQNQASNAELNEEQIRTAAFFDQVDLLIKEANQLCKQHDRNQVASAFMFAAARFNTWVAANHFADGAQMQASQNEVSQYLMQQFEAMLSDNYAEYTEQFANYMRYKK